MLFNSSFYLGIRLSRQTIEAGCNKQTNLNTRAKEIGQCCDPRSTLWSAVASSMEQSVLCVYSPAHLYVVYIYTMYTMVRSLS